MADLILRLPFLSVVSANDVKHMQTVLVWWGSGAGVRVERECEARPWKTRSMGLASGTSPET